MLREGFSKSSELCAQWNGVLLQVAGDSDFSKSPAEVITPQGWNISQQTPADWKELNRILFSTKR